MKTEEEIREQIEEYKESLKHREKSGLDMLIGAMEQGQIAALEWVLEE